MNDTMANPTAEPTPVFRLPGDIIPLHYDLNIITYLENDFSFEGDVAIQIKCLKPTNTIKIHARDLVIPHDKVSLKTGDEVAQVLEALVLEVVNTSTDADNEFFVIETADTLAAEKEYSLKLSFSGKLEENLIGYYLSSYHDRRSDSKKWLAVTHFEPSDARQAFPCFDEPGMKATFAIRLAHKQQYKAVSNMHLLKRVPFYGKPSYVWSEFERSVPMSTYLVAYMISELEYLQSEPEPNEVIFRVWVRPDAIDQAVFPAEVGPHFLNFYEDFFGVQYPLTKQDLLAIPDFKIGAMENWGIITFRESSLLLDERSTSSTVRLHIASIIAHELAHMWFGNLVTMWWWTDLWLKEGFATYMAGLAVHHEFPEWNSLDAEALSDLLRVFHLDSLLSSHPVSVPIGHSKEISQIFDAISYDKGSFLLRMMSLFLGEEVFRHGVSMYLLEHQYNNADQDDLWASLTEQAHRYSVLPRNLSVKQIMDTWTLQTGYPVITVERVIDGETTHARISQERYLANKSENESDYQGSWWVPLSYSTELNPNFNRTQPEHWLSPNQDHIVLELKAAKNEWIILNNRAAGLYKVNYDDNNWKLLINALNSESFKDIDVMNRALLIIDSMDLANCGDMSYELSLQLINYVKMETEFVPWNAALSKLDPIKAKLSRTSMFGIFKNFMRSLLSPVVESLGSLNDRPASFEQGRLLNLISQWGASLGVGNLSAHSVALFNQWVWSDAPDAQNPIPKDVRRAVYSHAIEQGGEDVWNFLWERYKNCNVVAEKNNILMALTSTKEVWIINKYLEWTLTEESGIRKQDAFLIFKVTASKELGFYVAQKFFFRNIERISKYFGANSNLIGHYFSAIADQMIYRDEHTELEAFAELHKDLLAPASLTVNQALESVELNIRWMEKHYASISTTLMQLVQPEP